jgi:hypothetical protein
LRLRLVAALLPLVACGGGVRRFPLRAPMWRDTDLDSMSVPCRPDPRDPARRLCRPEAYESSYAWDAADNMVFRPLARFFAVDPGGEAVNVNSLDEVPDSSWFTNRLGRAPLSDDELERGPCGDDRLDPDVPDGSWIIDQGKLNGANPGFRVRLPDGRRYMLKSDLANEPERATGATAIGARVYHAAGFWAACDTVIYLRPGILRLLPGLTVTDNSGTTRAFDQAALDSLLAAASRRGDRLRVAASRWLPGRTLGPFTYAGRRDDDPADVIAHEDRRDLRGARLLAAWLSHFDAREQNTLTTWMADDPGAPDSSPGKLLHYYIDFGDCFGSWWKWDDLWRRIGHAYYLDIGYLLADFVTLGLIERPWERARLVDGGIFGYYSARDFDPEAWVAGYPNPAFDRMTERDGAWMARIIARFTDERIAALVAVADFTDPAQTAYLAQHMRARRDLILRRYFARLPPIADLGVEGDALCGLDLARQAGLFPADRFRYRARLRAGPGLTERPAAARPLADGRVCVDLPRVAPAGAGAGDPARYLIVELENGQARGRLHAHLYDQGAERGFALAGIERHEGSR